MKTTYLLRLQAPLQAWGMQSNFSVRDTTREPTRSGVVGLLCAALGWGRDADLSPFSILRMGVRVDAEGTLMMDFQTAREVMNATGKSLVNVISNRYYLSDAAFLVGLESEDADFLVQLDAALKSPQWLLYLGRRAFPPSLPVWLPDGLQPVALETALRSYPWLVRIPTTDFQREQLPTQLRLVLEGEAANLPRMDVPRSFEERTFSQRQTSVTFAPPPERFFEEVYHVADALSQ